jgi:osmotically-inducible protein OsmY
MTLQDTRLRRLIQKELVKRSVDTALINVFVTNGVVTLQGELHNQRGYTVELKQEMDIILNIVRGMRGVRDIVNWIKVQAF